MCGIAGIIDLTGMDRMIEGHRLKAMGESLFHRGPDQAGYFKEPGIGLISQRLIINDPNGGKQPIVDPIGKSRIVYNGEIYNYHELATKVQARGHSLSSRCDTDLLPILWREYGELMWPKINGQFAVALVDKERYQLHLCRDRFGISPLYYSLIDGWIIFGSEIKSILASGLIKPKLSYEGLNQFASLYSLPGPATCFHNISLLQPAQVLSFDLRKDRKLGHKKSYYWGHKFKHKHLSHVNATDMVDTFEHLLLQSVKARLKADVPVASYLSGGVDSSLIVAMANRLTDHSINTYTVQIKHHGLDESHQARDTASRLGAENKIFSVSAEDIKNSFPELIRTTEAPILDLSCVALMKQAKSVSSDGFRVVLSGEGADEWLAGYPWHKLSRFLSFTIPTLLSLEGDGTQGLLNKIILRLIGCDSRSQNLSSIRIKSMIDNVGGVNGWVLAHAFVASSVLRFFNRDLKDYLESKDPYADIFAGTRHQFDDLGMLDRELLVSFKIQLAGMLLSSKGDRISMHSSLETRYPFLDNDLAEFLSTIPPDMKLRGFTGKYLLRQCASRWLPKTIAWRRKAMFRAPFSSLLLTGNSCYVDQLLSAESIAKSGYFDKIAVSEARKRISTNNLSRLNRLSLEIGLVSVISIQLWHQAFLDPSIAEI